MLASEFLNFLNDPVDVIGKSVAIGTIYTDEEYGLVLRAAKPVRAAVEPESSKLQFANQVASKCRLPIAQS